MVTAQYTDAISLLQRVRSPHGFLASAAKTDNYHRVWARDGVICGLAALASGDPQLVEGFRATLQTLAKAQHESGTIPSNVGIAEGKTDISYGGLAGRVDNASWFVIGVCAYAQASGDEAFAREMETPIRRCLTLMQAWEFNNRHLMYVPLSGNWADEYITEGYTLYDQLLRIWALRSFSKCYHVPEARQKADAIAETVVRNFTAYGAGAYYHEKAYAAASFTPFAPCCFTPAGYKPQFDAFAHALFLLLDVWPTEARPSLLEHCKKLAAAQPLGMLPAFWPPVQPGDAEWNQLENNCKYEFRNFPYEFHNGGSWPMVNGFYGMALVASGERAAAETLYTAVASANAQSDVGFYENFHTQTGAPIGVPHCSWSAAGQLLLHQYLYQEFKFDFS